MYISQIYVNNFRNLNDITLKFHPKVNYIIGEHNIGKTNILRLIDKIFNGNFEINDFYDPNETIDITVELSNSKRFSLFIKPSLDVYGDEVPKEVLSLYIDSNNNDTSLVEEPLNYGVRLLKEKFKDEMKNIFVLLDEPENHLNPFMQRSLINKYKKFLNNEDLSLNSSLNISNVKGQLFIATHASDVLVDDYKQILRLTKNGNVISSVLGNDLNLEEKVVKHSLIMFKEYKEAFFAKRALIVEGISEYAAFDNFAKKLNLSFDDKGVCLINGLGEGSIIYLKKLLEAFKIETYIIYDADVKSKYQNERNAYFTNEICFEMELVASLINKKAFSLLKEIASSIDNYDTILITFDYVKKLDYKLKRDLNYFSPIYLKDVKEDHPLLKEIYFSFFFNNKGVYLGKNASLILPKEFIPNSYKKILLDCFNF